MTPIVLVVDDDLSMRELVSYNLTKEGLRVLKAASGREALSTMAATSVDLVLLDLMLPDVGGLEVCRRFRAQSRAPVVVLTAHHSESQRIRALEAGADDTITKPFSLSELLARTRAQLRRWSWQADQRPGEPERLQVGPLALDLAGQQAHLEGEPLHLTPMEFAILRVLARTPGRVFPRERLLALATGQEVVGSARTVDVHVRSLRLKMESDPANPTLLQTVRGAGYCLGRDIAAMPSASPVNA